MSQINVNNIVGKNGASAVSFPHGITVTGVVTATSLNQTVNGNITATSFTGPLTGNVTGNVTGNCSGTAGSLAAGATGADLTLSGDLTVNGTTTTIDTAVTAVDSLAVDGNIGIGTTSPSMQDGNNNPVVHLFAQSSPVEFRAQRGDGADAFFTARSQELSIGTNTNHRVEFRTSDTERFRIDQHGTSKFKGPLTEKCNRDTGAGLTGDYNHDLITYGNVHWATST